MHRSLRPAHWLLAACLLTVGVMPRTARAQDDFARYLSSAVQLYESLEYEEALEQVQRAKGLARGIQQDVAVALHEGIILAEMGKAEPARVAFRRGLTLDPEAKLPIQVAPKVARSFEEVRASVQKGLARSGRAKPPPPPPAPPAPEPKETKPPAVAGTDRPEKAPEPPKLDAPVAPAPAPYAPTVEARARSRVPMVPLVLGSVGAVAAGVGTFFGLQSSSNLSAVKDRLASGSVATQSEAPAVRAQLDNARGQALVANVMFGTAVAAVTGAIVTYLFSGDDTKTDTREAR
jgi:hypothetical protein